MSLNEVLIVLYSGSLDRHVGTKYLARRRHTPNESHYIRVYPTKYQKM